MHLELGVGSAASRTGVAVTLDNGCPHFLPSTAAPQPSSRLSVALSLPLTLAVGAATDNIVLVSERTSASVYSVTAENLYPGQNHIWAQAICASGPGLVGASPTVAQPNIESLRQAFTP